MVPDGQRGKAGVDADAERRENAAVDVELEPALRRAEREAEQSRRSG
jgi:hypothetical protein